MPAKFSQHIQINLALIFSIKKKISKHSSYTYLQVEHISSQKNCYCFYCFTLLLVKFLL